MKEFFDGLAQVMTIIMPILLLAAGYWIAEGQKRNAAQINRQNERQTAELKSLSRSAEKANQNAEDAANEARLVKITLANNSAENKAATENITKVLNETSEVTKSTHILVNNNMGIQLELNYELSKWKADREPTSQNIAATKRAKKLLDEHQDKQARSDALIPRENFGEMPDTGVTVSELQDKAIEQIIEATTATIEEGMKQ